MMLYIGVIYKCLKIVYKKCKKIIVYFSNLNDLWFLMHTRGDSCMGAFWINFKLFIMLCAYKKYKEIEKEKVKFNIERTKCTR